MGSLEDADSSFNTKLLTTVYKQYWPVPGWNGVGKDKLNEWINSENKGKKSTKFGKSIRKTKTSDQKSETTAEDQDEGKSSSQGTSFSKLDTDTLKRLGWSLPASEKPQTTNIGAGNTLDVPKCKITKGEFRRLSDQVREVNMEFSHKFRPAAMIQESYRLEDQSAGVARKNSTHVYRSQLAASLRVFQKKKWHPLTVSDSINAQDLQCRPISCQSDKRCLQKESPGLRCSSAQVLKKKRFLRPRSVPISVYHRPEVKHELDVGTGYFDTLDSALVARLVGDRRPQSSYGDRVPSLDSLGSGQSESRSSTPRGALQLKESAEASSTSGVESILSDVSSSSEDEAGTRVEPSLESNRQVPQMSLRPEKWDSICSPPGPNDPRRFDFDVENVDIPLYEFADPLPEFSTDLDLLSVSRQKPPLAILRNTRETGEDWNLFDLVKRLAYIEKLQTETVESERRKKDRQKQGLPSKTKAPKAFTAAGPNRDKSCSSECLQVACSGNCPCKRSGPDKCGYSDTGNGDLAYDSSMRQVRSYNEPAKSQERSSRPKSCNSCKKIHTAKYINANNLILGRPRSSHSTYSSGQGSRKPKDLRPVDGISATASLVQEFEKLGMKTNKPVAQSAPVKTKGRNAIMPGKSFFSQRRDSLTKTNMRQRLNAMAGQKLKRQRIMKRPKTAE